MPLPANAMASFSSRINNRYLHIFLQLLCQSNLALAFQTFCHTLNYTSPALGKRKIFLSSIYAEEKVYSRVFLLPTYVVFIPIGRLALAEVQCPRKPPPLSSLHPFTIYLAVIPHQVLLCTRTYNYSSHSSSDQ